jgi:Cobinamide kinase / cobinamide phosphate guanyltransferase
VSGIGLSPPSSTLSWQDKYAVGHVRAAAQRRRCGAIVVVGFGWILADCDFFDTHIRAQYPQIRTSDFRSAPSLARGYLSAISDREITLVLGGARSGKSRRAESLITVCSPPWYYVAIVERLDDEMRARIVEHRARGGADWRVIDAASGGNAILIDCLTLWLSNLMLAEVDIAAETERLEAALAGIAGPA